MSWCSDHGIPHSELLQWDDNDRAKLLAFLLESSSRCTQCGTSPWEWEEMTGALSAPYLPVETTCPGCAALEAARHTSEGLPAGTRVVLEPRAKATAIITEREKAKKRLKA